MSTSNTTSFEHISPFGSNDHSNGNFQSINQTTDNTRSLSSPSSLSFYSINEDSGLDSTICYYQDTTSDCSMMVPPSNLSRSISVGSDSSNSPPLFGVGGGGGHRTVMNNSFETAAGIADTNSNGNKSGGKSYKSFPISLVQPKIEENTLLEFPMGPPTTIPESKGCSSSTQSSLSMTGLVPFPSKVGKIELRILSQPSSHHRARYRTEGSRGAVKDRSGRSFPVVKLIGYNSSPVKLRCYIGHEKRIGEPHLFYQVSKIIGKNVTPCEVAKIEGIKVIEMDLLPENNMELVINCIGIVKERNFDVQKKAINLKKKHLFGNHYLNNEIITSRIRSSSTSSNTSSTSGRSTSSSPASPSGPMSTKGIERRSTSCTLVFGCQIPATNETLQVVSDPINCAQLLGSPEVHKISCTSDTVNGGREIFVIGKNFTRNTKIQWDCPSLNWFHETDPETEFLNQNHLIFKTPPFPVHLVQNNLMTIGTSFRVNFRIKCLDKTSDVYNFTFMKESNDEQDIKCFVPSAANSALEMLSDPKSTKLYNTSTNIPQNFSNSFNHSMFTATSN